MLRHINGVVNITGGEGPVDPGYGQILGPGWNPVDPGWGTRPPTDPGYGRPDIGGGRPDNDLPSGGSGHVWGALIRWLLRPQIDGGPAKPPGRPILPPRPDNGLPPNGGRPPHPWRPGHWEPIDPGYGKPPLWGWVPGVDNGLPVSPGHPDHDLPASPGRPGHELPGSGARPGHELPTTPGARPDHELPGQGGVWVPGDPDYGIPERCPGGRPHPPIWAWIPDRPDVGGKPHPDPVATTIYPATVTVLASGGSGSVNITTEPAGGSWTVDPASVPDWITLNPMTSQSADTNLVYTATANTTGLPKQALIRVNTATLTINQGAV